MDYLSQVPLKTRLLRGQYFTPRTVCDLMLAWGVTGMSDCLLEPGCGDGSFLVRAHNLLCDLSRVAADFSLFDVPEKNPGFSGQLLGVDSDPRAAVLCAHRLRAAGMKKTDILAGDFLSTALPDVLPQTPDLIIGNPPYVRHEHLKQNPLFDMPRVRQAFASFFGDYLSRHPEQAPLFSGRGDLSVWFLLQATRLLQPGGRLAFIISGGWLDTSQGRYLRQFLLDYYTPHALMESAVEPWFQDAAINPVILFLRRRNENENRTVVSDSDAPVHLIRFGQSLADWLPDPGAADYWSKLRARLEPLRRGESARGVECRSLPVSQWRSHPERSWFFDWRAPDTLRTSFTAGGMDRRERWCVLETLGHVRYPVKTGINRFFYVTGEMAEQFGIEPEFLVPVVKSAKAIRRPEIFAEALDLRLFSCLQSMAELERGGKTGALAYIRWGEEQVAPSRQKRARPIPWPQVSSVQGRPYWYALPSLPPADILCSRFFDRRFFFAVCREPVVEDQTFYGLTLRSDPVLNRAPNPDFIAGLLNALPTMLMLELWGRSSLGEGVLQFSREDMARLPVPDPGLWREAARQEVAEAFRILCRRPVLPVAEELRQPDRRLLDGLVLAGLFPGKSAAKREAIRNEWAQALVRRVAERTGMAAGRRNKRRV